MSNTKDYIFSLEDNKKIEKALVSENSKYKAESKANMIMFAFGLRAEELNRAEIRIIPTDNVPVLVVAISADPYVAPRIIPACEHQINLLKKIGINYPGVLLEPVSIQRIELYFEIMLAKIGKTNEEIKSYIHLAKVSNVDGMTAAAYAYRNNLKNIYRSNGVKDEDVEYLLGNEGVCNISYRHAEHRIELASVINNALNVWRS